MRITYYALKPIPVGDDIRQPGDLIPEANEWSRLSAYLQHGEIAPVLVVTLPEDVQEMLLEWEAERQGGAVTETDTDPVAETPKRRGRKPAADKESEVA